MADQTELFPTEEASDPPPDARAFLPDSRTIAALRGAAAGCRGCPLHADATQTVFSTGAETSELVLVGEQPGDREDIEGEPFVGPAGAVLDRALGEAGIARERAYLTNAVKHFKWRPQGKRRLHQTPRAGEIQACSPWLEAELEAVRPRALVALGATAARSVFGSEVRVMRDRGSLLGSERAEITAVTIHPSAVLRTRGEEEREDALRSLVEDLELVRNALEGS